MRGRALLLVALPFAVAAGPSVLEARSLVIERFDAEMRVNLDGTLEVKETIRARFAGRWDGIVRSIRRDIYGRYGHRKYTVAVDLESISITDDSGRALPYKLVGRNGYHEYENVKILIPDATDATRTVILRYRVNDTLALVEKEDDVLTKPEELHWSVTGDGWEGPIEAATSRIWLPVGVTGPRAKAFTVYTRSRPPRREQAHTEVGAMKSLSGPGGHLYLTKN